jgi:transposase, IS30 family
MGKSYSHISLEERYRIALLHEAGQSFGKIATALGRSPSTISREIERNSGRRVGYKPAWADDVAWARRWKGSKLERQSALRDHVLQHLAMGWSPEQIAGRLTHDKASLRISHESIYRFIYTQTERTKDYSWRLYLPQAKARRGWGRRQLKPTFRIKHRVCISQRPLHIENRKQIGHWEADLLHPRKSGACVLVAVERATLFVRLARQDTKHAHPVAEQLSAWFKAMPKHLRRTLTQDNGPEFAEHQQLHALDLKTYFCKPHHPWEKGSVENMNGRLRKYIPLGTDPESFSNQDLINLADRLNNTPRKRLGFKTPAELFLPKLKPLHFKCESTFPLSWE